MRLSELGRATGLTPATIKFYLREGLLPPGERTSSPKLADYGHAHIRRLRLIRTLTEVGGLSLAAVRQVLAAIEDPALSLDDVLGVAHSALAMQPRSAPFDAGSESIAAEIDDFLAALGWRAAPLQVPARDALAANLAALRLLGWNADAEIFLPYARLADELAERELATVSTDVPRDQIVEAVVVGTVVFESALIALRRLAHAHHSALRLGTRAQQAR